MNDTLVTRKELAKYMNVSVSTIKRWEKEGMPVIWLSPVLPRYDAEDCMTWLDAQQQIHNDLDK